MTEDEVSRGFYQTTAEGVEYPSVTQPNTVETIVAYLATGENGPARNGNTPGTPTTLSSGATRLPLPGQRKM